MCDPMAKQTIIAPRYLSHVLFGLLVNVGCSGSPTPPIVMAQTAYEQQDYDQTVSFANLALQESEGHREARVLLAAAHRELASKASEAGNLEEALDHYVSAAHAEPSRVTRGSDALRASREAQDLNNSEVALEMAALAVEANPASMEARRNLATLLDENEMAEQALTHYLWIWEADRTLIPIGLRLAGIYLQLEQFRNADAVYSRVLEKDAANVQAYLGRADALERLGQTKEAEKTYQDVILKFPENASLTFRYADFVERLGDAKRAEELRSQARGELPKTKKRNLRKLKPSKR